MRVVGVGGDAFVTGNGDGMTPPGVVGEGLLPPPVVVAAAVGVVVPLLLLLLLLCCEFVVPPRPPVPPLPLVGLGLLPPTFAVVVTPPAPPVGLGLLPITVGGEAVGGGVINFFLTIYEKKKKK